MTSIPTTVLAFVATTFGLTAALVAPAAAQNLGPPELIAAAKSEGKLIYYTANFAEVEQEVIKQFNKRFPEISVEMLRAPGGQLITRVKTEAAAGKLVADVVDHSDRALMSELVDMFQDYAPPNGKDYLPESMISPKLWPRATLVWSIAYNSALIKTPPKTWMDLTKPPTSRSARYSLRRAAPPGPESCSSAKCWVRIIGRSRRQPIPSFIRPARRCRTRSCAARS
jgi:iron(III) transport system substrate-binding protein